MIKIFVHKNYEHIIDVIPMDILRKDWLTITQKSTNESCVIPSDIKEMKLNEILYLSEISSFETEHAFIVKMKVPTANINSFRLYKPIPIPFSYKNETFELTVQHNYYLIRDSGPNSSTYSIPLSTEEKTQCQPLINKTLCFSKRAMQITQEKFSNDSSYLSTPTVET